jgi:prepilin-type processing-associated H-X9-DG protein
MYAQDYDETLFPWLEVTPTGLMAWDGFTDFSTGFPPSYYPNQGFLQPYMKNTQIEDCPTAAGLAPFTIDLANGIPVWAAYGVNMTLMPINSNNYYAGLPIAAVDAPADTVFMGDAIGFAYNPLGKLIRNNKLTPPSASGPSLHGRHNGVANTVWMDGHVKAVRPTPPPNGSGPFSADLYKTNNVGDLTAPAGHESDIDYYFELTKKN